MKEIKVRLTFTEDILGTTSADPDIYKRFIGDKAENDDKLSEELLAIAKANSVISKEKTEESEDDEETEPSIDKGMTIFPRNENGEPFLWDYQIKGFFKDACSMLRKVSKTESSKIKAHKKEIDGLIFIKERKIPIKFDGKIGICQRPLRAQTAQGERIALSCSESIPAGATVEFTIICLVDSDLKAVQEWLEYGQMRGIGQWRNSSKGRFSYEKIA